MGKKRNGRAVWAGRVVLTVLMLLVAGCSQNNETTPIEASPTGAGASPSAVQATDSNPSIDWEARKELNADAGKITYMTGYYYAASPPDMEAVMADELGYFEELGLEVEIQPGLESDGMKLLAAGKMQMTAAGTPSTIIHYVSNGAPIKGVATYASVGISALMVMDDSGIDKPSGLVGKTLGYHGALPANFLAMFEQNGINPSQVKSVSVGYDPTILSSGKVDALTVYKSNEPYLMEQAGFKVRLIDPGEFGAETSFGVVAANDSFAEAHPTAVEDFLRAVAKAHEYAITNPEQALKVLEGRSKTAYDVNNELNRWSIESRIVEESRYEGHGVGWQTSEQWQRELDMLLASKVINQPLNVNDVMDNQYMTSIYDGETVIWP